MPAVRIHEIARLAGVSIGTVDRALHNRGRIKESTSNRILQIAKDLGYRPNLAARALSVGRATIRIGVCMPREAYFYDQIRQGLLAESHRYGHISIEFIYRPVDHLGLGECERVRELLASDIRALIIVPGDHKRLSPLINEAEKRDVRVICVATDAPASNRSTVICVDPELNGRLAGELMGRLVSPRARVAVITGVLRTEDHFKKVQGFCKSFPLFCQGGKVVEVLEGHDNDDETFLKSKKLLREIRTLGGLYVSTGMGLPVCRALNTLGLAGKIKLITTDLFEEMVPYFEKGTIFASIYQRPYVQGQTSIRLVVDHAVHGQSIPPAYYLNPAIVMRSNLYLFRETRQFEFPPSQIPVFS